MEKFSDVTKKYIIELLDTLETTNDKSVLSEIADDLKFSLRFNLLMEELVIYALEKNKLVNSFYVLKSISRNSEQRLDPDFIQQTSPIKGRECERLTQGVTLFKGSLLKILEKMKLAKSKEQLVKYVVISDEENGHSIYSKKEVKSFDSNNFEIVLKGELEEKYSGQPIVINLQ